MKKVIIFLGVLIISSLNQANSNPPTKQNQGPSAACVTTITKMLAPLKMTVADLKKKNGWAKVKKKYHGTAQWKTLRVASDPSVKLLSGGQLLGDCDCSTCNTMYSCCLEDFWKCCPYSATCCPGPC